jgi:hypothetical protein
MAGGSPLRKAATSASASTRTVRLDTFGEETSPSAMGT